MSSGAVPDPVADAEPHVLRASGMSDRKGALRALAERFADGRVNEEGA